MTALSISIDAYSYPISGSFEGPILSRDFIRRLRVYYDVPGKSYVNIALATLKNPQGWNVQLDMRAESYLSKESQKLLESRIQWVKNNELGKPIDRREDILLTSLICGLFFVVILAWYKFGNQL